MKRWLAAALAALIVVALVVSLARKARPLHFRTPHGTPIADIARGEPAPSIGLMTPFPAWTPLPDDGLVTGAGVYRPRPPWGASAVIMLLTKSSFEAFEAAYRARLAARGFDLHRIVPQAVIDPSTAQFEADEREGGHVVYVTFWREGGGYRSVQLTFWSPPAPRVWTASLHALRP
jgi:hypothetical protein